MIFLQTYCPLSDLSLDPGKAMLSFSFPNIRLKSHEVVLRKDQEGNGGFIFLDISQLKPRMGIRFESLRLGGPLIMTESHTCLACVAYTQPIDLLSPFSYSTDWLTELSVRYDLNTNADWPTRP